MADSIRLSSAAAVKALIAEVVLGPLPAEQRVGDIVLRPHQANAAGRVRAAMAAFGGALLCDDVGMGKTFVAAAILRDYRRPLVVAPAALRTMWHEAMAKTRVNAAFVSFERLSRHSFQSRPHDIVVVDEAHHARNPRTKRYSALATIARDSQVLLMSATPIHNRPSDLLALLSLFLGERAKSLTVEERSRCIVRRERDSLAEGSAFPQVAPTVFHELPDDPSVLKDLLRIPSPLPVRDGSPEGHLFVRGLIHQWASSEAALFEAIRRRRARAHALIASLESGVLPTAHELSTWAYGEGTLQLGFAELLSQNIAEPDSLLASAREHLNGLEKFLRAHSPGTIDTARVAAISAIRRRHPGSRIVAFAQYAETITNLYRRVAATGRVAMLTAKGARIASGRITRGEVVSQFQPGSDDGPPNNRVELLLTTDLLSEGVNLQGADVVIHLDLPWTAARLEQRTGRAARLGSPFTTVHVYTLRPPASARAYLESETIITTKWTAANAIIGNSTMAPFAGRPVQRDERRSVPRQTERLRALLECWRSSKVPLVPDTTPFVASVESETDGFVAVLQYEDRVALLCGTAAGISADLETVASSLADIRDETLTEPDVAATAIQRVEEWIGMERASHVAGLATTSELVRRRRLLEKIDSTVRSAAPHQRPARTRLAVSARATATRFLSAAAEAELELLERSTLPPDMWLQAVAEFSPTHPKPFLDQELLPPHIIAVLLLTRPPPAFECGGG